MIFRLAKKNDQYDLANVHLECGKVQPDSFMHKLGKSFLTNYYKIILDDKSSVILVAENENKKIVGFCCGTISMESYMISLKEKKYSLAISTIPAILRNPGLLKSLISHKKFITSGGKLETYGINHGSRCEYWGWLPTDKNPGMAITLLKKWLKIMFEIGSESIKGETDIKNTSVLLIHKALSAEIVEELNLPDGRNRVIYEYNKSKFKIH